MFEFLGRFFKDRSVNELRSFVDEINRLEEEVKALSSDDFLSETSLLKERLQNKEDEELVIPRAFALAREAAWRTLHQRPYDVQLLGGLVIYRGAVAEMSTGEGKTLAAVAPVYLNALHGRGVHVMTVNDYLARRDTVWMGQIYHTLGLSVACIVPQGAFRYDPSWKMEKQEEKTIDEERDTTGNFLIQDEYLRPITRREAYEVDITYGTNSEFGFDYLRDNLAQSKETQVQREHFSAIIDEVDSILIDEARTPLIISAADTESSTFYKTFARIASTLEKDRDYVVDEKLRSVAITDEGIERVEKAIGVPNIYAPENLRLVHYLEESLKAKALFHKDKEYVVKDGEIVIIDEFTGRMLRGRRYSGGLHQAIEAKESVNVQQESRTYAKISIQNYARLYQKIAGMTGTAQTSAEEFHRVYGLDVVSIPTHRPLARKDLPDVIYKDKQAKWKAIIAKVKELNQKGQPVLLGTTSIEQNELISQYLAGAGIQHEVLNAKNNEREGAIIAQAGRLKAVTVATNVAGRGVDIILGGNPPHPEQAEKVRNQGGLFVLGTDRHEARRIDNQLRGRAGRQGDPGASQFFLSLEDDLMRIFGGDRVRNLMDRFNIPDDLPIDMSLVSRVVQEAQAKVEGAHFDMRKHLLEYDDVLNKQRLAVYKRRQEVLGTTDQEEIANLVLEAARNHQEKILQAYENSPDKVNFWKELEELYRRSGILKASDTWPEVGDLGFFDDKLEKESQKAAEDPQTRNRLLGILDLLWLNHLENIEALSESVGLRAYGQKDPLVEYRRESRRLYDEFWINFNGWIFENVFRLINSTPITSSSTSQKTQTKNPLPIEKEKENVGRNDPCPCGSGKKYKKCHGV
ncbi:MAG: preprotein translocase subunit SecA [Anaplasmataceae bacterium]|nr:preprotein translocase subunit SecA [Anaplasmataceae bacterium]